VTKVDPKLEGSNIVDVIPHSGYCPNDCISCYYNSNFYLDIKKELPLLPNPSKYDLDKTIFRVNSGHDSNMLREMVIESCKQYPLKYYNTAIPENISRFDAPVILTVNGVNHDDSLRIEWWLQKLTKEDMKNLMAVRFRANCWNIILLDTIYRIFHKNKIPIIVTPMRYQPWYHNYMPKKYHKHYILEKHITNQYYVLNKESWNAMKSMLRLEYFFGKVAKKVTYMCGKTYENKYCRDCGQCEKFFWDFHNSK